MAKYLLEASYTAAGMAGVLKEGGTSRRNAVEKLIQNLGGTLESFDFAFGDNDIYIVATFPSNVDAAAVAMNVGAAGAATLKTNVLLSPEEIDQATEKTVEYRAPGK
ncbi:MAG: hypothetical protein QOF16_885 [Actinomycetota bacterium]|jgi:uncharacterized protein with GYD domain|nr:hypothetical protein [Actinomycetota bacterium]